MKKQTAIIMFLTAVLAFSGCGKKKTEQNMLVKKFEQYPETVVEQEQAGEEAAMQIKHAAFLNDMILLDYRVSAPEAEKKYMASLWNVSIDGEELFVGDGPTVIYESGNDYYCAVAVVGLEGLELTQDYIGETAEINFETMSTTEYNADSEEFLFEIPIMAWYESKITVVEEEIPDTEEQAYIESIETNPFFTRIYAEVPESMKIGEYRYVLCTEDGKECEPSDVFFWSDESDMGNFYFESLPENTENVNLTLGKTDKSGKNSEENKKLSISLKNEKNL